MKFVIAFAAVVAVCAALPLDDPQLKLEQKSDVDGSYTFQFASGDVSKTESRRADGAVVGAYQYLDSNGVLQKVQYEAGQGGVHVEGSNLPVGNSEPVKDTPEVVKATQEHLHEVQQAVQREAKAAALEAEYRRLHPEEFL